MGVGPGQLDNPRLSTRKLTVIAQIPQLGGARVGMILIGAVLLVPPLQLRAALIGGPISDWVDQSFGGFSKSGLGGQFGVGLLLGAA
jgi:hypothetical protein